LLATAPTGFVPVPGRRNLLLTMFESPDMPHEAVDRARQAAALIVPSDFCEGIFRRWCPGTPVYKVPLGVTPAPQVARTYPLDRPFRWLWVGAMNPRKGWIQLSDAWDKYMRGVPAEFYIKTTRTGRGTGEVRRHGAQLIIDERDLPREALNALYGLAHGFAFPSMSEGFGLCVDPTTPIQVPTGVLPMADIQVGDQVLTRNGWRLVLAKTERDAPTRLRVRCAGTPPLVVTPEHPFLAWPGPRARGQRLRSDPIWTRADQLGAGSFVAVPRPKWTAPLPPVIDLAAWDDQASSDATSVWRPGGYSPRSRERQPSLRAIALRFGVGIHVAEDAARAATGRSLPSRGSPRSRAGRIALLLLAEGYTAPHPIRITRFVPVDTAFLDCVGWYLAEGSACGGRGIEFSLALHEESIARRLAAYLHRAFGVNPTVELMPTRNGCRVVASSTTLAVFFKTLCGNGAARKRLHPWLLNSAVSLGPLVAAYVQGDGHVNHDGITITTASPHLAWQLRMCGATAGVFISVRGLKRQIAWELRIGGDALDRFSVWTGQQWRFRKIHRAAARSVRVTPEYLLVPVRAVHEVGPGHVMDIQVDDAHEFVGGGVLLHNTLAEAMSSGLPCVTVAHGGVLEFADRRTCAFARHVLRRMKPGEDFDSCAPDGRYEFAAVSSEHLARAMLKIMRDYDAALAMGQRAATRIRTRFTWARCAAGVARALRCEADRMRRAA